MLIGCCSTIDKYNDVVRAGFDYIELPGGALSALSNGVADEWAQIIHNIPCLGLNAAVPPHVALCGPDFSAAASRTYAHLLCKRACPIGVKMIGIGSPQSRHVAPGYDMELAWKQAEGFLYELCDEAARFGMTILWEPLNLSETIFGVDSMESYEHIARIASSGINNIGMVGDFYHMAYKGDTVDTLKHTLPMIKHLHIASLSDGKRGYATDADRPTMLPLFKECAFAGLDTISAEAFDGTVAEDGSAFIKTIKDWIKDCT